MFYYLELESYLKYLCLFLGIRVIFMFSCLELESDLRSFVGIRVIFMFYYLELESYSSLLSELE